MGVAEETSDAIADAVSRVRAATVDIRLHDGASGAGIVWSTDGLVITNAHVASRGDALVRLAHGESFAARVVARDESRDLAALRIDCHALTVATPAYHSQLRPGELVFAIGSPHGLVGGVATGVVHSVDRGHDGRPRYIQTSVRLAPGNSGGPLADVHGRVHGVNSMIVNGVGVARGLVSVRRFLTRADGGRTLGVSLRVVALRRRGARSSGLLVLAIRDGSVASLAGLAAGDVLLSVDGHPLREMESLIDRMEGLHPAEPMRLEIGRSGRVRTVVVHFNRDPARAA